ncbi:MAG: CBS domain-containing protein [Planctomycetes bacterium]|nr:CBS domain-containing protein [Planctomycetota bacterium]
MKQKKIRQGDEFIKLFNELESTLRHKINTEDYITFHRLVDLVAKKDYVVRRNRSNLKSLSNLRNAIVHDPIYPLKIIADPREETLDILKNLLEAIINPQKLIPKFQNSHLRFFELVETLTSCLSYMDRNDFSQVVVFENGNYRILSSEGIISWLRSNDKVGLVDLENAIVGDALPFEDNEECGYLSRNDPVELAIELFEKTIQKGIARLNCILVTHSGKPNEKPLGIITPWDLMGLVNLDEFA